MKRLLPLLLAALFFSGCASYNAFHEQDPSVFAKAKRVWVKTNFDDNHSISIQIVEALRNRGLEVESGPITMMTPNFQYVVEYRDDWAWDFRDHLVGLRLRVMEAKSQRQIAVSSYVNSLSLLTPAGDAVELTVKALYEGRVRKSDGF